MRLDEIQKKIEVPYDPIGVAREQLEKYKEDGIKLSPNGTLQLFIPRKVKRYDTRKEKYDYLLKDRGEYAFDDNGELLPHYKKWLEEGAPIIGGGSPVKNGQNKPTGALLWTSTAIQKKNGTWDSSWNKIAQMANFNQEKVGYLYKVLPNTVVYELDGDTDAEVIYDIFYKLGRSNTAYNDKNDLERIRTSGLDQQYLLTKDFPWQDISFHFDCIHHNYRFGSSFGFNGKTPFTYGWDCESSCWFKPDKLELLGQVKVYQGNNEDDEY